MKTFQHPWTTEKKISSMLSKAKCCYYFPIEFYLPRKCMKCIVLKIERAEKSISPYAMNSIYYSKKICAYEKVQLYSKEAKPREKIETVTRIIVEFMGTIQHDNVKFISIKTCVDWKKEDMCIQISMCTNTLVYIIIY